MASVIAGLKSVDFYRKLKKDLEQELTEASFTSACLSVLAALCMLFLVIAEFSAYMHVTTESTVVLDHGLTGAFEQNEDSLQINFNISFPHLKCEYASVDATNFMGTHDASLGKRVSKVRLGGSGKSLGRYDDGKIQSNIRHVMDETPHDGAPCLSLDNDNFDATHHKIDVMLVNFFAPWCHWCQRLEPVWEKAAQAVRDKYDGASIVLGKVDCTHPSSESLCIKWRVDAFPTILVFRKDDSGNSEHESYHGERSVPAITAWADNFVKQLKREIPKTRTVDADKDGRTDSHAGVGCMISGLLHVQKAPGMLVIQAKSDGHEFNWETMDVSHTVNHLSFGPFLSETDWMVMPPHIAASVGALDDKAYASDQHIPTTHEHYVKVVKHEITPPSSFRSKTVSAYGYTAHSNNIQKVGEVPTVRLNYDILPIVVQFSEKKQAFYHFITQLCAIIGGVFTVAGIVASITDKGINLVTKKQELGKLG